MAFPRLFVLAGLCYAIWCACGFLMEWIPYLRPSDDKSITLVELLSEWAPAFIGKTRYSKHNLCQFILAVVIVLVTDHFTGCCIGPNVNLFAGASFTRIRCGFGRVWQRVSSLSIPAVQPVQRHDAGPSRTHPHADIGIYVETPGDQSHRSRHR